MHLKKNLFAILPLFILSACSTSAPDLKTIPLDNQYPYSGLKMEGLGSYHATFLLQFDGENPWLYQVDLRSDGNRFERALHIEGVDLAFNPGDVRMVTQGGESRMSGPGTDGECLVFPAELDIGPAFLLPDQILAPSTIGPRLSSLGKDTIAGAKALRFGLRTEELEDWSDAQVDIWLAEAGGNLLRYDLQLTGEDPLFGHGRGSLSGRMIVNSIGPQVIEPVDGCELEYPIPDLTENLVKLPDFLAFDSSETIGGIAVFYQENLMQDGWVQTEEPEHDGDALVLSFQQGGRSLHIILERTEDGVHAEIRVEP